MALPDTFGLFVPAWLDPTDEITVVPKLSPATTACSDVTFPLLSFANTVATVIAPAGGLARLSLGEV